MNEYGDTAEMLAFFGTCMIVVSVILATFGAIVLWQWLHW